MAAAAVEDPYTHTKAGTLGCHRETMLQNELLLLPELGKPMRRGYANHVDDLTFGSSKRGHDGGTREAMCWKEEERQSVVLPLKRKEKKNQRNFQGMNRAAVQAGLTSSSEQYNFRATHDIRRKQSDTEKNKSKSQRLPPTMTYGISTRPSTPIFELLENKYQDIWLEERRQAELAKREKEQSKKHTFCKISETRASLLRQYQNPVESKTLWKMPRFQDRARPHLQTFRSAGARNVSFKHQESDGIARAGTFNGIYKSAQN